MSSHQALQGHLWCGIFTGATTPRRKRRKVAPVTPRLPIRLPTAAVQTPVQPPRFEFPSSVQHHLPQAIADMVGESSGDEDEDGQQEQHQRQGLSPVERGLQRPLNLPAPIPFRFPSTPGGSLVLEPPPPPPVQRPRPQTHASTKVSLHRIQNHNQVQRERLTTFIADVHVLARHTTFFIKYYLADHPLHDFPDITDKHISVIFELLNNPGYNGNPVIVQELRPRVQEYCNVHGFAPIRMRNSQQTAAYTATSIFTNLKVNVQEHFMQMFLRYVNERLGLKQVVLHLRRAQRRHYYRRVHQFTKYATFEEYPTEEEFARLTRIERTVLDELWALFPPQDEPLAYSLAVDAMAYLGAYCELSCLYERRGMRLFSAIPLRKSRIQSSVRIDTLILGTHILDVGRRPTGKLTDERKQELWGQFLNVNKLGLKFDGSISTNGYSVTIHFKKPGLKYGHRARKRSKPQMREEVKQLYFEHHIAELREAPNIVCIDPGKHDLLFCRDIEKERPFRYTSTQRAKSMNIEAFSAFIVDHIHADPALDEFYRDQIHVARRFKAFSAAKV
ncbi:uncharacterized protein EV422DRAFT_621150 [Fimicolochytrium jonesii]|uniref:uncharacterized protein n=1 Tax=Fimicolochytrium jonesii TaxID=1396493 RepID=UPI0022FDF533|nr:uncharacterized protein EV422DRAFT_621150 [Fimicolochytrium jonesii]KAI8819416.1 hypothetical protein EV422DRAFT_621150 [Fimicolochytrium jonesii]